MNDLSFIIPIRVDSEDRIINCLTIMRFIARHFPQSEVQLIEQDAEIRTARITAAFPSIRHDFELNPSWFSKSRAVNKGVALSTKPLICMCDTDILLHPDAIRQACAMLRVRAGTVVIPHNRIFVDVSGAMRAQISESLDMETYGRVRRFSDAPQHADMTVRDCNGGIFLAAKETLQLTGGLNRKMISYGWEDTEFIRRLDKLGYYTFMLGEFNLVHLNHYRGTDSQINQMFDINHAEFNKINAMHRIELEQYVETDLDIAPEPLRLRRPMLRRLHRLNNFLSARRAAHLLNKIHVKLQTLGVAELIRHLPQVRRLSGIGKTN